MPSHTPHAHPPHTPDVDFGEHAEHLEAGERIWADVQAQIAAELPLPAGEAGRGSVAVDVGCGAGRMSLLLADRVGATGRVYALDREPVLLDRVRERAADAGLDDRVRTVAADFTELPGALPEPADLVWSGHVVHHAGDQAAVVAGLVAALAPGGVLAIAEGGLPIHHLPWDVGVGRPGLELRLVAALDGWFGAMRGDLPGSVREPRGWSAVLAAAGLVEVTARGWLLHRPPPLSAAEREFVVHGLVGRVERAESWLSDEDRASWERLLDSADDAWLGNRDDLDIRAVDTVYLGRRPPA